MEKSRDQIVFSFYTLCTIYVIVNADMHACMWNIENMFLMHFMCLWFGKSDIAHYFGTMTDRNRTRSAGERYVGGGGLVGSLIFDAATRMFCIFK